MNKGPQFLSFSYPTGQPFTPTKSPPSTTHLDPSFHTPETESAFCDPRVTWNTANACGSSPPIPRTPQRLTVTTQERYNRKKSEQKGRSYSQDLGAELASHIHHLSPNPSLELPPVDPSRQLSSSPNPSSSKRACHDSKPLECVPSHSGPDLEDAPTMRSTGSVQTPPPTTTSASKRKAKQAQVAKLVKKSASGARKLSSTSFTQQTFPQQNHDLLQESPQFFPTLQFSPDVFAFPSAGPATAPIYPHQKLFWDPDTSMGPVDMDFSGGGLDLFNSNPPFEIDTFMTTQSTIQPVPATSKSGFGSDGQGFMAHNPAANLLPTTTSAIELSSYRSSTAQISTQEFDVNSNALEHAVDPNLLLSTSDLQHPPIRLDNSTGKLAGEVRQPYLHQMQESRREKELERVRKVKSKHHPHPPVAQLAKRTSASNQEKRPRLERRSTDTIVRKASGHASKQSQEPLREPSRHVKRRHPELFHKRSSPVKSQPTETRDIILGEPKSEHPARVTFTIDNNGRARTEATMKAGGSESETDQDTQVTGSRAWENSDSETSEDADADFTTSFRSSFTFPTSKQPKLARFSTDSISHSKKSSYSSTYASSRSEQTVGDSELGSRPHSGHLIASASNKFSGIQKARGTSSMSSGTLSDPSAIIADEPGSEADTVVDSDHANGDAQHALKKVLKDRARKKRIGRSLPTSSKAREKPHHQDFPPTKHQTHSSRYQPTVITPTQDQHSRVYGTTYNLSPTTITDPDLTSPSTDRGSSIGDSTRCVCHSSESGGHLMIQCDSCKKWLHVRCIGLVPERIPPVYVCIYCMGQTPNIRGGRVREPSKPGRIQPTSPLAHKSHKFR